MLNQLIDRIKGEVYKPGSRLPTEQELGEEFQVSRNCIREAIKCMTAGGLLVSKPGKGSFLTGSARDIVLRSSIIIDFGDYNSLSEILELRLMIEPESAAIASRKAKPEQVIKLRCLLDILKKQFDQKLSWVDPGLAFHNLIAEMTGNTYLIRVMKTISEELYKTRDYLFHKGPLYDEMWEEHQNIYKAIMDKDPERARNFMRLHIEHSRDIYLG